MAEYDPATGHTSPSPDPSSVALLEVVETPPPGSAGADLILATDLYDGHPEHAEQHNLANAQVNWLTEQSAEVTEEISGRLSAGELTASYVARGTTLVALDTDGVPYLGTSDSDLASSIPVAVDSDGVPFVVTGA